MKASNKDILREIKKSGMRFFYISAIIALGVAFFCGIKATAPSMIKTAEDYFANTHLSDFRLLSTYGFRDEDIERLANVNGVEEAVGGYSMDVIMQIGEDKDVIKILSMPNSDLNAPILLEGKFPTSSDECVIESQDAHIKDTSIGQQITVLDESHTPEELENLTTRTFTIVGFIQSPQYISLERGNTNISDGTIDGYMMVPTSSFNYERYTEAYVYTDVSANDVDPYSDEYSKAQEQMISRLEQAGDEILDDNIYDIRVEALKTINEHQDELNNSRNEFDTKIAEAEEQINSGQAQLAEGYASYYEGLDEYNTQMSAAEAELAAARKQIEDGFVEYEAGRQLMIEQILAGQNQLLDGRNQLLAGYDSYNQGLRLFNEQILAGQLQLDEGEKELEDGFKSYNQGLEEFNSKIALAEVQLQQSKKQLDEGLAEFNKAQEDFDNQIGEAQSQLDVGWNEYNTGYTAYTENLETFEREVANAQKQIDAAEIQISDGEQAYEEGMAQYQAGLSQYNAALNQYEASVPVLEQQIATASISLTTVENNITNLNNQYSSVKQEYEVVETQLNQIKSELSNLTDRQGSLESTLSMSQAELTQVEEQLITDPTNQELLNKKANLESIIDSTESELTALAPQIEEVTERRDSLQANLDSLSSDYKTYTSSLNELTTQRDTLKIQISTLQNQISSGKAQLDATKTQLDQSLAQLNASKAQLEQSKTELAAAIEELAYKKEAGLQQLEAAKEVLDNSYSQLSAAQAELDNQREAGQAQLDQAYAPLAEAQAQIEAGEKELESQKEAGLYELNNVYAQLLSAQEEIINGRATLEVSKIQGQAELDEALTTLQNSEKELADGEATLEASRAEGEQQLAMAYEALIVGQNQLLAGQQELISQRTAAQIQLAEALGLLESSEQELEEGKEELETQRADGLKQLNDAQSEINQARTDVNNLSRGEWYVYDRDDNPGYTSYQEDTERIDKVANVFPLFFFLVAALVAFSTMTRMVEEERTQIGTLYALGYTRGQIIKKYVLYAGTAALIGSTLGWIFGVLLLPWLIFTAYGILYSMPDLELNIPWNIIIISYIVSLLCTVGASIVIALAELRSVPAELMRPKAPKPGKRILIEKIPYIWNKLNFISKVSMRNIFRYKARFLMTVLGIAGCTALILAGFGLHDAIFTIIPNQFGNIFKYDQSLIIKDTDTPYQPKLSEVLKDERVAGAMPADQRSITVTTEDGTLNTYLIVPSNPQELNNFIGLHERTDPDTVIPLTDKGVVVSEKLATNYGATPGSTINLEIDNKSYPVTVAAETENYLQNYIYMSPNYFKEVIGESPSYSIIMVDFTDDVTSEEDQLAFASDMIASDDFTSAINTSTIVDTSSKMMNSLNIIVIVMIISAGILAFIVLNNLTNINISERIREIATLKVLGFKDKETNNYIFRENIVLSIFGILVGLVLGVLLLKFIILTVELDIIMFGREINIMSYVYAIFLTLGFTIIVNYTMIPVMRKINMVEALKDID